MEDLMKTPQESEASVQEPKTASRPPPPAPGTSKIGSKFNLRRETPVLPTAVEQSFPQSAMDTLAAGNQSYTIELKEKGMLGHFFKRENTTPEPTIVELRVANFWNGFYNTIRGALLRLHKLKTDLGDLDFNERVNEYSSSLASGCCLIAYLKIRAILLTEQVSEYSSSNLKRPRAPADLPIPSAFAFAIQQLGIINVSDIVTDISIIPTFPSDGHTYGCPTERPWNSNAYAQAMEYARKLGMQFAIVDLKVKEGSAWFLLRQVFEEDIFELQCILPESNYTDATAAAHCLFLQETSANPSNVFVDLSEFTGSNFGSMVVNPHPGINLSCFEAVSDSASEVTSNI